MPRQFSTEAANADKMGEDQESMGQPEAKPDSTGADGTPRDRSVRAARREGRGGAKVGDDGKAREPAAAPADAKPGKDINAPGFVKDTDNGKP